MRTNSLSAALAAVATLALVAGAVAPAAARADDTKKQAEQTDVPMDKKVCMVRPAVTGTILKQRVCKTRAQWIAETGVDPLKAKKK